MKHYWLRLFPELPLHIENERVLPASALRGAIASILLGACVKGHEHDSGPCGANCRYWSLFGDGANVRIGPAYAGSGDETEPLLTTARTCSAAPGFKAAGGHGVCDIAMRQWLFEQADPQRLFAPFTLQCPTCNAPLHTFEGLVTRQGEREFALVKDIAAPVEATYTSFNRTRKRVVERYRVTGKLVSRGIHYVAKVDAPDRLDGLLHEAVAGGLWIGGRRSRGMGALRTELVPRVPDQATLADRIARFNRAVRTEARFYAAMDSPVAVGREGEWYFTLDMRSPILAAYDAVPSIAPPLSTLPGIAPVRHWLSPQLTGGWHAAAGLPRRTQLATTGVILYKVPAETNRATVEALLTFVESEGLGRERGYGAITICDQFHLFVDPL